MISEDIVRVLRVVEYVGTRSEVERVVTRSLHGTRFYNNIKITAVTLGDYPDVLERAKEIATTDAVKVEEFK